MLCYCSNIIYLKYLVILVYIRGVVVSMLYISCICWNINNNSSKLLLLFIIFVFYLYDQGLYRKFSDLGEFLWMYLFFSFLFNVIVVTYSLNLFKVSGSLRF